MRITRTALLASFLASLVLASGCGAELAIAPVTGAGVGALVARDRRGRNTDISLTNHVVVGTVLGFLVDAIAIGIVINDQPEIVSRSR